MSSLDYIVTAGDDDVLVLMECGHHELVSEQDVVMPEPGRYTQYECGMGDGFRRALVLKPVGRPDPHILWGVVPEYVSKVD